MWPHHHLMPELSSQFPLPRHYCRDAVHSGARAPLCAPAAQLHTRRPSAADWPLPWQAKARDGACKSAARGALGCARVGSFVCSSCRSPVKVAPHALLTTFSASDACSPLLHRPPAEACGLPTHHPLPHLHSAPPRDDRLFSRSLFGPDDCSFTLPRVRPRVVAPTVDTVRVSLLGATVLSLSA